METTDACPHCRTPMGQSLRDDYYYTCASCGEVFIHYDVLPATKEAIFKPLETGSPIIIGSRGKIADRSFTVTGSAAIFLERFMLTIHSIVWHNDLPGFLIENDGDFFMVDARTGAKTGDFKKVHPGKETEILDFGKAYCYSMDKVSYISLKGTGKLAFSTLSGSVCCGFYKQQNEGAYAFISKSDVSFLSGKFYDFKDLNLSPGMSSPALKSEPALVLNCVQCAKETTLYTRQKAHAFCCSFCGTYNEYSTLRRMRQGGMFTKAKKATFKIGTVFHIEDIEFVLINYLVKEETAYKTSWTEYTLYHPVEGCRTLSESDGHYTLLQASRFYNKSNITREAIHPEKGNFALYSRYKFTITHAEGEFLSDITGKELPACDDYVNPPYILTYERTSHEAWWYEGEYVSHKILKSWLKEPVALPQREGVGPSEPYAHSMKPSHLVRFTVLALGLLIAAQVMLSVFVTKPQAVSAQSYTSSSNAAENAYVSPSFEITANHCAVDFIISSDLANNWLETDFTMVNETTGDQYYFSGVVEYYFGFEGGESWSEGSRDVILTVENLTKGRYHYNVTTTSDAAKPVSGLVVTVLSNVSLLRNFWLAALCLLAFPLYIYIRRKNFERRQWANSDYSPFHSDD